MMSAVIVASIAIAVILGYKTKINTGLFCFCIYHRLLCARPEAEGTDCFLADQHDVRNSFRIAVL